MGKRQALAAITPLIAATLAGCGGSSSTKTTSRTTATPALTVPHPAPAAPASGPVTLQRIFAAANRTVTAHTVHVKWVGSIDTGTTNQVRLEGSVDDRTQAGIVALSSSQGQLTAAFRGQDVWLTSGSPIFTAALPHGKRWVHASPSELGTLGLKQPLAPALLDLNLLNGIQHLYQKGHGAADFRWSLPLAMAHTAPALRARLAKSIHITGGSFLETGNVALGADGTIRSVSFDATSISGTDQFDLKLSLELSGVGAPVTITPPPAAQVVPLSSVPTVSRYLAGFKNG